jgi:hypothetical protein
MSDGSNEFVLYEPAKSVDFCQQTREKNPRKAWPRIEAFLDRWTVWKLREPIHFNCDPGIGSAHIYNAYRGHANEQLGTTGEGLWQLPRAEFARVLALAFDEDKWPRQTGGGPAHLSFTFEFEWAAAPPPASSPLRRTSSLHMVIGGKRIFVYPTLVFPWPVESGIAQKQLRDMDADLPIELRDDHFRRMLPTRTGNVGYRVLRLPPGWRATGPRPEPN